MSDPTLIMVGFPIQELDKEHYEKYKHIGGRYEENNNSDNISFICAGQDDGTPDAIIGIIISETWDNAIPLDDEFVVKAKTVMTAKYPKEEIGVWIIGQQT